MALQPSERPPVPMRIDPSSRPMAVVILAVFSLSCMDAAMKVVSMAYPLGEVVCLRYATGSAVALAVFLAARQPAPSRAAVRRNGLRALIWLVTAGCFFAAVARLPLAETIALTFLAPLLISCLGWLILGEPVSRRILFGIVLGLAGVVVIALGQRVEADRAFDLVGVALALACAFFYALSNVLMRRQSGHDSIFVMVLLPNLFCCAMASPALLADWHPPSGLHLALFGLAGLLGTAGHLCMAWAYARAPAATLGVFEYTAFLWASLLGFAVFAEVPSVQTLAGAAIIIAACVLPSGRMVRAAEAGRTP